MPVPANDTAPPGLRVTFVAGLVIVATARGPRRAFCARWGGSETTDETEPPLLGEEDRLQRGGRAIAVAADVSQSADVAAMIDRVTKALGPIDILINNAGMAIVRSVDDLTEAEFDLTISVNLKSAFLCTQAVLPAMRARQWGRIVNISSGAARGAGAIGVHYNASKAGMEGLTRGYAARLVKDGITVNAVAPSLIETDMVKQGLASSASRIPLGRFGTPEECALIVMMLVRNAYMTGQTVALSGGLSFV